MRSKPTSQSYLILMFLWLLASTWPLPGCGGGSSAPNPEPELEPPVIYLFQTPAGDQWEETRGGPMGATIGIVGENFGNQKEALKISFNGAEADIQKIENANEFDDPGLQRIITTVPQRARSGPVTVTREGIPSKPKTFLVSAIISRSDIFSICFDSAAAETENKVWLGTLGGGLISFNGDLERLSTGDFTQYTTANGLLSNDIKMVLRDSTRDRILLGTEIGGLSIKTNENFVNITQLDGLSNNMVNALALTPAGDLLLATNSGLSVWKDYADHEDFTIAPDWTVLFPFERIDDIQLLSDGFLIASTDGLSKVDVDWDQPVASLRWLYPIQTLLIPSSPEEPVFIYCLKFDNQGRILAGTYDGRLFRSGLPGAQNPFEFEKYTLPLGEKNALPPSIGGIIPSPDGNNIYMATFNGLYQLILSDEGNQFEFKILDTDIFYTMALSREGKIWLGAVNGIYTYDMDNQGLSNKEFWPLPVLLMSNKIQCLAPDGFGGLLIGTKEGGLTRFSGNLMLPEFWASTRQIDVMGDKYIQSLTPVPGLSGETDGKIWVGAYGALGLLTCTKDSESYETLIDWRPSYMHAVTQTLPSAGGQEGILGTTVDGLLYYSEKNEEKLKIMSHGTFFTIEDLETEDFNVPLISLNAWGFNIVQYSISDFKLNEGNYNPAGGICTRFDSKTMEIYTYFDMEGYIQEPFVSNTYFVEGAFTHKGTITGLDQPGQSVQATLFDLPPTRQGWLSQAGFYTFFDPDWLSIMLEISSEDAQFNGSGRFEINNSVSGAYLFGFIPWGDRMAGDFTLTMEALPVPVTPPSPTFFITALLKDPSGNVLVGTEEDGLFWFTPNDPGQTPQVFSQVPGPEGFDHISALVQDPEGQIYVGTIENGLFKLTDYTTSSPTISAVAEGKLLSSSVTALELTEDGYLLIGMYDYVDVGNRGVSIMKINSPPAQKEEAQVVNLDQFDGILPARIQDFLLMEGNLYIAIATGLCVIENFSETIASLLLENTN